MRRTALLAVLAALAAAGHAVAAGPPTVSGCLHAWNAPGNVANRQHLARLGRWSVSLHTGVTGVDSWVAGSRHSTSSPACQLTLTRPARIRLVVGVWASGTARSWSFWKPLPNSPARPSPPANVRIEADGRLRRGR